MKYICIMLILMISVLTDAGANETTMTINLKNGAQKTEKINMIQSCSFQNMGESWFLNINTQSGADASNINLIDNIVFSEENSGYKIVVSKKDGSEDTISIIRIEEIIFSTLSDMANPSGTAFDKTVECSPNPFGRTLKIDLGIMGNIPFSLSVFNIYGEEIKVLKSGGSLNSKQTAFWDGTDISGKLVAKGYYLLILRTSKGTYSQRILFLGQ